MLSVFGRGIKGMIQLLPEQVLTHNVTRHHRPLFSLFLYSVMYINVQSRCWLLAPVTNWETHGLTLAGYCYAVRHGMKVQLVTPYRAVTCNVTALRYEGTLQVWGHLYNHSALFSISLVRCLTTEYSLFYLTNRCRPDSLVTFY